MQTEGSVCCRSVIDITLHLAPVSIFAIKHLPVLHAESSANLSSCSPTFCGWSMYLRVKFINWLLMWLLVKYTHVCVFALACTRRQ